ncbi:MAG TPA: zinc ribbon domain-containing protein, partial [Bryobacteraceae bacterium]|nr:zinc ribbon domain-containing protein [Bryobacteraceae bacterium]
NLCHTEVVPEFCTCGVQLPPDARFCHKCGKPQYDYPGFEVEEVAAAPLPPPLPVTAIVSAPEISFHNRLAVRIGFLVALVAFLPFLLLSLIPFVPSVVAFFAGFLAVFSYSKLTGQSLSVRNGARMGWITGIFSFGIIAAFLTLSLVVLATQGKNFVEQVRQYQGPFVHPNTDQIAAVTKLLQDPATLAMTMAGALVMLFIILTALPMLGGALGAKVFAKE